MALLWTQAAQHAQDWESYNGEEPHDYHALHPAFEAAGIKHAPCGYTRCDDHDGEHSDAFDEAERRSFDTHDSGKELPREKVDLSKPVHGFESTADLHTLRKYTADPTTRPAGDPVWFRSKGKHYIFNGHHGTAAAMRRGDSHLHVRMIDLDKDPD